MSDLPATSYPYRCPKCENDQFMSLKTGGSSFNRLVCGDCRHEVGPDTFVTGWLTAQARIAELEATNKRLNRRAQLAESAVAEKIQAHPDASFGRILANAGYRIAIDRIEQAEAALAERDRMLLLACLWLEKWAQSDHDQSGDGLTSPTPDQWLADLKARAEEEGES